MKKLVSLLLCFVLLYSLAACSSDPTAPLDSEANTTADNPSTDNSESTPDAPTTPNDLGMNISAPDVKTLEYSKSKLYRQAMLDLDGDGTAEHIIQSPNQEYTISREHNGKVYSYCLDRCDYYRFNTDGTFFWCSSPQTSERVCGLSKIVFDGEALSIISIYSLKHSNIAYEYYVSGEPVTEDEYYDCRLQNYFKDTVDFSYLELAQPYPIDPKKAWNLANEYWNFQDGCHDSGAGSTWINRIVLIDAPNSDTDYYRVAFQMERYAGGGLERYECMPPSSISEHDQILVNAFTGKITTS